MQVISGPYSDLPVEIGQQLANDSLLSSPGFLSLWETNRGLPVYWTVLDSTDRAILTVGSIEFRKPMMRSLQLLVDGLYCRIRVGSSTDELIAQAKICLWKTICSSGYSRVHLVDFDNCFQDVKPTQEVACETLIASIDSPDWMPPDKKIQSECRKAERENITVQKFVSEKHLDQFMKLMFQAETRHSRQPKYERRFFEALARLSESDDRIDWSFVEVDGHATASHINLIEGDMLINWQVYFDKQYSWLKPNQYLLVDAIHRGWSVGVRRVNFGATPDSADGVKVYKEKWGGQLHCYRTLVHRKGLGWLR